VPATSSAKRGVRLGTVVSTARGRVTIELVAAVKRGDGVAFDPAGGANPTPQIDVLRIIGSNADGGLQLVQSIQLPTSASSGSPTGIAVSEP
jgi:hypothetical protein